MTERIDLDELADASDEAGERPNRGDWLWREEGDPAEEPPPEPGSDADGDSVADADERAPAEGTDAGEDADAPDGTAGSRTDRAIPHVPRANKDKPVGIPVDGGGAGGGRSQRGSSGAGSRAEETDEVDRAVGAEGPAESGEPAASGPHGGDADDMTMALTYEAATRLAHPAAAFADAAGWADWVGIVGDVGAPAINKFQRDHGVDVDFFNGSGDGPGERLAEIDRRSMFYAERMVVVGVEGRDEPVARVADWEFVPLATAAAKAGWELRE